ncbi:MAG: hypothetical protein [Bacteriophage sp.]|nr:MAG: hypothetical protein [Bacteriophage sp.]
MKDYSAMSDFEINKQVAIALELKPYYEDGSYSNDGLFVVTRGTLCLGRWNPCNEPHQAWPIIAGNKISLDFDGDGYEPQQNAWCKASTQCGHVYYGIEKEPLRNAMIVYLQMMEQK